MASLVRTRTERPQCSDKTPLTEWPDTLDFVILCVNNGDGCWVKGLHFEDPSRDTTGMLAIWPDIQWVGAGGPEDWHVHRP